MTPITRKAQRQRTQKWLERFREAAEEARGQLRKQPQQLPPLISKEMLEIHVRALESMVEDLESQIRDYDGRLLRKQRDYLKKHPHLGKSSPKSIR